MRIVVTLEGNTVQAVVADAPAEVVVVDYNVRRRTDQMVQPVKQVPYNGHTHPAILSIYDAEVDPERVEQFIRYINS